MKPDFWHERWELGEIGFHQGDFNRHMQDFFDRLGVAAGARILVPLCGKSLDMLWMAEQGFKVTGIEISELAVHDFFAENGLAHEIIEQDGVPGSRRRPADPGWVSRAKRAVPEGSCAYSMPSSAAALRRRREQGSETPLYRGENIEILCADFFTIAVPDLPPVDAVYDRASLIALPPEMRLAYAGHLTSLIRSGIRSLLVTLDYPQEEMRGPPFSVTSSEVEQLYSGSYSMERLHSEDCLAREPRFRKKGLSRLEEQVFLMQKI